MQSRNLGKLGPVSVLALGGGGVGQLWGKVERDETVATVRAAADSGITLLDMAVRYGEGEAESVVGLAFGGRLPAGMRVTTKCRLLADDPDPAATLERSLRGSLARMKLERVDLFFLHNHLAPDGAQYAPPALPWSRFTGEIRPALERMVALGLAGAWGFTGIGVPKVTMRAIEDAPQPAAILAIANFLDSTAELKTFDEPLEPRNVIACARRNGVGVLGVRAAGAGAFTDTLDRELPADHPILRDYRRAEPFRRLARELGESPAALAHRYALGMDGVTTVVLGVKNRVELAECVAAAGRGPLDPAIVARIDALYAARRAT
ncbi:MAG TPA: aldo/keto reductase [Burkholderiales bacterium]|nr:aldo/keto reductase [Burkholderiales bacterium]